MNFRSLYAHGFARVAAVTHPVALADPTTNAARVLEVARELHDRGVAAAVFPELDLTGYSIDDLVFQDVLLDDVLTTGASLEEARRAILEAGGVVLGAAVVAAALLIPLTLSDVSGRTLWQSLPPDQWIVAITEIEVASSWRWAAIIALVAGIGQRLTVSWRWSVIWLRGTTS